MNSCLRLPNRQFDCVDKAIHRTVFQGERTMGTFWTKHLMVAGTILVALSHGLNSRAQSDPPAASSLKTSTGNPSSTDLSVDQIVAHLISRNESRAAALRGYTGRRVYRLEYHGLPRSMDAELVVESRYSAPATRKFIIVSETGSKLLLDKVLKRLLASEEEAQNALNKQKTALTPENYVFELAGEESTDQGRFYILNVRPRIANKFLYRGEVWVDADDFAVARIDAEPAENPSFWIRNTTIKQTYAKFGSFWLPLRNQSVTKVRFGGTAKLLIEYQDYNLSNDAQTNTQADLAQAVNTP